MKFISLGSDTILSLDKICGIFCGMSENTIEISFISGKTIVLEYKDKEIRDVRYQDIVDGIREATK